MTSESTTMEFDPVTFTVLRYRLDEIVAEAYHTIGQITASPVVYEAGDHQEAICTVDGKLAEFGAGVLHWTMAIGAGVRHVIEQYSGNPGIGQDDQFLLNDPYVGPLHGPDVQMLAPVHFDGELIAWVGSSSHQLDIGGIDPGSLCVSADEVFQEGFLCPGVKFVEDGTIRRDIEQTFRNMTRTPEHGLFDIRSKIAANNVMKMRLIELAKRYGVDTVKALFSELIKSSEERVRRRLREIPDGRWASVAYVEALKEPLLRGQTTVIKEGDNLTFDLTGCSPQALGSENVGVVGAKSSAAAPYVAMLCHDLPWNEGLFRPLDFVMPEGTIANPVRPAAMSANIPSGCNVLVESSAQNALGKMVLASDTLREEACANFNASCELFVLAGQDGSGNPFTALVLDLLAGGAGGRVDADGADSAVNPWSVKNQIANAESNERMFPILYLWRKEVTDSGGPGKFRGGVGLHDALVPWGADQITDVNLGGGADQRGTLGLSGGYPAGNTPVGVVRGTKVRELFAGGTTPSSIEELAGVNDPVEVKSVVTFGADDVLHGYVSSGGGGFGDPLEREPWRVLRDVANGYVSARAAGEVYGVMLTPNAESVDEDRTVEYRRALLARRLEKMRSGDA